MRLLPASIGPLPSLPVLLPRRSAAICAVIGIWLALRLIVSQEVPVGRIEGQVTLADSHRPLAGAEITLSPHDDSGDDYFRRARHAVSDAAGRFVLNGVPVGAYDISAVAHAHQVNDVGLHVDEGRITPILLDLQRNQAECAIKLHQRVYGTTERARLSISGYVDPERPRHRDSVRLRLYKTRLSAVLQNRKAADALDQVGRAYDPALRLPDALLESPSGTARRLQPLLDRQVKITGEDLEGFYYQKIPLGSLPTGLYLLEVEHDKATACTWLLVTDTALVVKRAGKQMLAYAVDIKSGAPVVGCDVLSYRGGRVIAQGKSDPHGLAELTEAAPTGNLGDEDDDDRKQITTVAVRGQDEAVIKRDFYRSEEGERYAVHAYTDRTIYRPGQRIYFKAILREKLERATRSAQSEGAGNDRRYTVPVGLPVRAELRDKAGERIFSGEFRTNDYGSFTGAVDLLNEAATGVYTLILHINSETHTHDIVIASYRKPEFAVTVTPEKRRYIRGETAKATLQASYFFGAPVAGAKIKYTVYRSPDWAAEYGGSDDADTAEDDSDFSDGRGGRYYGGQVTEGETRLDADGKATLSFAATGPDRSESDRPGPDDDGPQAMIYTIHATVTEGEDREATADSDVRVVSGDFRLSMQPEGYVAEPGHPTTVTLIARDHDGKPVPNQDVTLESGYERWKDGDTQYRKAGQQAATTDARGQAVIAVTPAHTGDMLLTARALDHAGRAIVAQTSLWAAQDGGEDMDTTYNDLSLLTDRRHYAPGQTARVLINTAHVGQTVLLTVEGDHLYRALTVPITHHSTTLTLPIRAEYGPNVMLDACYVQNKHYAASETPLRVSLPDSAIRVDLQADREVAPGDSQVGDSPGGKTPTARYGPGDRITYRIRTTDRHGNPTPCELSLGVVDESLYALREDTPTALRDDFYPRRSNEVSTTYSFAVEYLGDADKAEPQIAARKRFLDTACWQPNLRTDAQGRATVTFALPDNLTTWRATATAHTRDTRLGRAVDKIVVTKAFLVRLQTPRTLTQRDHSRLMALVHNDTGQPQRAWVRLHAEGLTVEGEAEQAVTLAPGAVGSVVWPVVADGMGQAKLRVTAWTVPAAGSARYTDGLETTLPVRAHGREDALAFAGELTASNPETEVVRLDPNAVPGSGRLTVRITPSLGGTLSGSLDYLIGFPYGCVEQTMSRLLPDLLVQRTLHLKGLPDLPQQRQLPQMVREGLQRLYRFRHQSGAWGWWEHDADDPWMTAYVLYGLHTAQSMGYPVSAQALAQGRKAAVVLLEKALPSQRPFMLYALALNGERQEVERVRDRMWRYKLSFYNMDPESLAYIILTDRLLGRNTAPAVNQLLRHAINQDTATHWEMPGRWDSDERMATATALRALLAVDPHESHIPAILRWLMRQRTGDYWYSTRDTSMMLAALCDYLTAMPPYVPGGSVRVQLNGREVGNYTLSPENQREQDLVLRVPGTALRPDKNDVTLTRLGGDSPVFYSVELRQTVASEDAPALSTGGLKVTREYLRLVSRPESDRQWRLDTEPTQNQLKSGDAIRVRLTIHAPRDMDYVLIEDPFPSGCEVNERGDADEVTEWSYWWSSQDVRDDRIAFFARTLPKGEHVIEYNLRAQTPGSYHALPTLVQPMYAPELKALSDEARVEIR